MSPLFSPLCLDIGWSSMAATFGDGEGVKTGWLMLVSKGSFIVSCGSSD